MCIHIYIYMYICHYTYIIHIYIYIYPDTFVQFTRYHRLFCSSDLLARQLLNDSTQDLMPRRNLNWTLPLRLKLFVLYIYIIYTMYIYVCIHACMYACMYVCSVLSCTVLYCTVLYCLVLYCMYLSVYVYIHILYWIIYVSICIYS